MDVERKKKVRKVRKEESKEKDGGKTKDENNDRKTERGRNIKTQQN
jgi:hypothetical protein